MYCYEYPMVAPTVDNVVFKRDYIYDKIQHTNKSKISVLLIQRVEDPYKYEWALPGGFVNAETELIKDGAIRELYEETGLIVTDMEYLGYYDAINRDPRRRVISHVFMSYFLNNPIVVANDDAINYKWIDINGSARTILAFDHKQIVIDACKKLGLEYSNDF